MKKDNWKGIERELEIIPGPTLFKNISDKPNRKKTLVLVYFIGGVTYGEITTLRWLS